MVNNVFIARIYRKTEQNQSDIVGLLSMQIVNKFCRLVTFKLEVSEVSMRTSGAIGRFKDVCIRDCKNNNKYYRMVIDHRMYGRDKKYVNWMN
jgi:hypothetical protein